jgi:hypothetical protein
MSPLPISRLKLTAFALSSLCQLFYVHDMF